MNRSRNRRSVSSTAGALRLVAETEPAPLRPPGVWTTPPIIPEREAAGPHRVEPWRTPPFNPGAAWPVSPVAVRGPVSGGLLDPIESLDPPPRGGLLDAVGEGQFGTEEPRPRIQRKDLPPELQGFPTGSEGGLIGVMLAEYVEPDADPTPARDPFAENGTPPIPPRKPAPPLAYPKIPLPASADWAGKGLEGLGAM